MMNKSNMGLYFIKEINGFKEEGEACQPRQHQDNCKHGFIYLVRADRPKQVPELAFHIYLPDL